MHSLTLSHAASAGWSAPLPQALDGPQTLVLVFGASRLPPDAAALLDLLAAFPGSLVVGCSTAGEIAGDAVSDDSLSVAIARFDHTRLRMAQAACPRAEQSAAAGAALAQQLRDGGADLRAVLVLSDGLHVNGTPLVDALRAGLPAGVLLCGGLAGDGSAFERTWVLAGGCVADARVVAVGFYGDRLQVGSGCDGGWMDFGPERIITRSVGNVLYELDGKPALDLYKTYLGELAQGLPGSALRFPLSIRRPGDDAPPLVRTILGIDEAQRALTFAGDMPEGHAARLMRTTNDSLIDSAGAAAVQACRGLTAGGASLVVSVSCVGRRLVLGERAEEEVESVLESVPAGAGHVGFYSYGEISPGAAGGASELHNQTMTVTVFSET
jgi:hypothetical protein